MADDKKLNQITGLWKNTSTKGEYLSGKLREDLNIKEGIRLLVFPNKYKEADDNKPDLILYWTIDEPRQPRDYNVGSPSGVESQEPEVPEGEESEDDLPF